jgi:hypothetical protein
MKWCCFRERGMRQSPGRNKKVKGNSLKILALQFQIHFLHFLDIFMSSVGLGLQWDLTLFSEKLKFGIRKEKRVSARSVWHPIFLWFNKKASDFALSPETMKLWLQVAAQVALVEGSLANAVRIDEPEGTAAHSPCLADWVNFAVTCVLSIGSTWFKSWWD